MAGGPCGQLRYLVQERKMYFYIGAYGCKMQS
jgi:hypothetical protein